jgi:hypothetical protein
VIRLSHARRELSHRPGTRCRSRSASLVRPATSKKAGPSPSWPIIGRISGGGAPLWLTEHRLLPPIRSRTRPRPAPHRA